MGCTPRSPSARDLGHPDCAALEEGQYRGLSTAAQKRAFGRDDKGWGGGERRLNCDTQVPKCEGPGAPGTRIVAGLGESQYRGFSTALRFGRNDSVYGGLKEGSWPFGFAQG